MPTYVYRCGCGCDDFTEVHPMASVPDEGRCPACDGQARRVIAAPRLGVGNSPAMRAQDATRATADTPRVVSSPPPSARRRNRVSANPLHRKLPRP